MSALGDADWRPVRLMCSRRAHHTYEVTLTRQPHVAGLTKSRSVADVLRRIEERKNRGIALRHEYANTRLPAEMGDCVFTEAPRKIVDEDLEEHEGRRIPYSPEGADSTLPRSKSTHSADYEERSSGCPAADSNESSGAATAALGNSLTSARTKLIQFLQTDEFFDEYSFIALLALILGHMFQLFVAVLMMGYTAQKILCVYIYVWRFMQARVADILATYGGPQAAYKFAVLCAELVVLFTCILVFTWAIFIPACCLIAVIVSNIIYVIT